MALIDEMKLDLIKTKFKDKLDSFRDWDEFKTFLANITKIKLKTFIKDALQEGIDKHNTLAVDEEDLKNEIDGL